MGEFDFVEAAIVAIYLIIGAGIAAHGQILVGGHRGTARECPLCVVALALLWPLPLLLIGLLLLIGILFPRS